MAHKDWCGKPCSKCENPCRLDEKISCSPDCKALNADGTRNAAECKNSGCDNFGSNSGECPVCGHEDLAYGDSFPEDNSYIYKWTCEKCEAAGREVYSLEFVCHTVND